MLPVSVACVILHYTLVSWDLEANLKSGCTEGTRLIVRGSPA